MSDDPATSSVWPIVLWTADTQRFLCEVLGFESISVSVDHDDVLVFEQLRWPGSEAGVLLVQAHPLTALAAPPGLIAPSVIHLVSHEADAIYERVLKSDAQVLSPPSPSALGGWPHGQVFTIQDTAQNLWTIGTHPGSFSS